MDDAPLAGRSLHFIGIGGAGMSGLALVAHALGARVTGSDRADSPYCERLRSAGLEPIVGHDAANVPQGAEVVVSTAIPEDNPELSAARAAGAPVLHRGDLLGELSRMKRTIAVSGTHGKTTTASMAAHVLRECGRDPAFLIGGELRAAGTNAGWGAGDWAVIEADESDRSFLKLERDVAVITNVELDHHSTYASLAELEEAFAEFAAPAELRVLGPGLEFPGETLGFGIDEGDLRARELELTPGGSRFEVDGAALELHVPGRHNVLNALAALAACRAAGLEPAEAAPGGTPPRRRRPWPASPARGAASRSTAGRRAGRSCTTTTPTIRPRSGPRSRPPARSGPSASWRASSRTSTRARAGSRASSGARSRSPTSWWCWTSTPRARRPRTSPA
jgi:UDP-N-acetylmuramate--alanine ligase